MSAITQIKPEVVELALAAAEHDAEKVDRAAVEAAKPTVDEIKAAFWAQRALDMTSSPTPEFEWPQTPAGTQKSLATEIEAAFWAERSPVTVSAPGFERYPAFPWPAVPVLKAKPKAADIKVVYRAERSTGAEFQPRVVKQLADYFGTEDEAA